MSRQVQQMRPEGQPGAMAYAPQRDLANIYTPMLREVFQGLDEANWSPYLRQYFQENDVTEEDLGQAVKLIVEAHRLFIRDREVKSPEDAFTKAGANELPTPIRLALFSRIGEVLMGGFFIALRDVTTQGQKPPADFVEMIAAGRALAKRLSKHDPSDLPPDALEQLQAEVEETQRALDQAHAELEQRRQEAYQAQSEGNGYKAHLERLQALRQYVKKTRQSGWFMRIWRVAYLAWKIYWKLKV